jgi:hypothetical protein
MAAQKLISRQTTIQRSMSANDVPVKRLAAIDDWTRNGKVKK